MQTNRTLLWSNRHSCLDNGEVLLNDTPNQHSHACMQFINQSHNTYGLASAILQGDGVTSSVQLNSGSHFSGISHYIYPNITCGHISEMLQIGLYILALGVQENIYFRAPSRIQVFPLNIGSIVWQNLSELRTR